MLFSDRTPKDLTPNNLSEHLERKLQGDFLDLSQSNPTLCGFDYPPDLLQPFQDPQNLTYEPFPFGSPDAREAVAQYLRAKGQSASWERIVLTASTSEAYSYIFKLLADPGASFLSPVPSYPLLDHLARLESVELIPFPYRQEPGWPLDFDGLEKRVTPQCRGLVLVDPNNPTGALLSPLDRAQVTAFCQAHSLALISDEVFGDFSYTPESFISWTLPPQTLHFRLGGLSKSLGLPQLKLSWIALDGPAEALGECLERLELIADTYLSVNTPVQKALPHLFRSAPAFQRKVLTRILANRETLEKEIRAVPGAKVWPAQAGWYALVEILGGGLSDEDLAVELLKKENVGVQPGSFFDFQKGRFFVVSLLPPRDLFQEGSLRLGRFLREWKD